ncbi:NADH-quinone oxidoreductase subunit J [Candidatus Nitrotoga fabula]|uniref:NADH-quinone oxidoreductase subunit J n=2 Tax=Candidatus Nitrotoga fabula TaxID=2182327 RepID=A0A916BHK1_9PROT|nr:NADH-quinone oxidoreductase subunit J [Candidatus Nitrotoga fabula]
MLMSFETLVFYMFAVITVFASLRVITARNPVHAALFLVLAFCTAAGVWMLLEAEFLAITLVLVYVGAVMVLFLFVVMMLDINLEQLREGFWRWFPFGALLAIIMVFQMIWVLGNRQTAETGAQVIKHAANYSNTKELGRLIYTDYVYAFELAAVLLLVAIVAAIALTLRRRKDARSQEPDKQILVKKADRLRIVSVVVENKENKSQ